MLAKHHANLFNQIIQIPNYKAITTTQTGAAMDKAVGEVVAQLEADSLLDDTIIFYYADNGGVLPNSKGYLTEMGLNVPLVISLPQNINIY